MDKKVFLSLLFYLILSTSTLSSSTLINCTFEVERFYYLGTRYRCSINNNPKINSHESAFISSVTGTHENQKSNKDILGLFSDSSTIEYFPKNIEKFFNNLEAIHLYFCPLKELFQSDLKPLTKLSYLLIGNSYIEVIEEGLFDFNPNLQILVFDGSHLIHIDPNVFDNLKKLTTFQLYAAPCSGQLRSEGEYEIKIAVQRFKAECVSSEYLRLNEQLDELKNQSLSSNIEEFKVKLESFEVSFKDSKFSNFRPLKQKFESLKNEGWIKGSSG